MITTTFKNNLAMLNRAREISMQKVSIVKNVQGIVWSLIFQPIPPAITSKSLARGGNVMGLSADTDALVLTLLVVMWDKESDDDLLNSEARQLIDEVDAAAEAFGVASRYKYLNYADRSQDPIAGYGSESQHLLQHISRKYDPHGVFQRGCPGGFKVFSSD